MSALETEKKRVALVIGNGRYIHAASLSNPANDASGMAALLRTLGFEVVDGIDLGVDAMYSKLIDFVCRIQGADAALFYFAGHGLQVEGENYLLPVDAKLDNEILLKSQTIALQDQLNLMAERASINILLLDCCRDNPFVRSFTGARLGGTRGAARSGLARIEEDHSHDGSLIVFATSPGKVAADGTGRNSPFTKALLSNVGNSNQSLFDTITDVIRDVRQETNDTQIPWCHSSLRRKFYFKEMVETSLHEPSSPPPPAPALPPLDISNETYSVETTTPEGVAYLHVPFFRRTSSTARGEAIPTDNSKRYSTLRLMSIFFAISLFGIISAILLITTLQTNGEIAASVFFLAIAVAVITVINLNSRQFR